MFIQILLVIEGYLVIIQIFGILFKMTTPTPASKMDILEMFEFNRKALKELYEKITINSL